MVRMYSKKESKPNLAFHGDPGFRRSAGRVDEEFHTDLKGHKARQVYREMADNSPILGTALWLIESLIRQIPWPVHENESGHPQAIFVRDFIDEALRDMEAKWPIVVSRFLTSMPYGWADLEPVYKLRKGHNPKEPLLNSKYDDGLFGWRDWAPRSQESIDRWDFDDNGRVRGWWQRPPSQPKTRWLPADRLLRFKIREKHGSPEGQSLFRVPYTSYFYSTRITEVEAIGIERQCAGLPKMEVPLALLQSDATDDEKAALANWEKFVKRIRTDEYHGAVVPSEDTPDGKKTGYRFSLVASSGRNAAEADPVVKRHEQRQAMSFFIQFLLLGQDKAGSWALSSDMTHNLAVALGGVAQLIADIVNDEAIPRLCSLNNFPPETYPHVVPGDIEKQSIVDAGSFVSSMLGSGGMRASETLNDWSYRMIGEEAPEEPTVADVMREPTPEQIGVVASEDEGPSELPPHMNADEVSELLGVSRQSVNNAIKRGQLPGTKIGNKFVMLRENVMSWVSGQ